MRTGWRPHMLIFLLKCWYYNTWFERSFNSVFVLVSLLCLVCHRYRLAHPAMSSVNLSWVVGKICFIAVFLMLLLVTVSGAAVFLSLSMLFRRISNLFFTSTSEFCILFLFGSSISVCRISLWSSGLSLFYQQICGNIPVTLIYFRNSYCYYFICTLSLHWHRVFE